MAAHRAKTVARAIGRGTILALQDSSYLAYTHHPQTKGLGEISLEGEEPVEWMLLSNIPVTSLEEACERVCWYSLRWRIEIFFKVLKSGFRVEAFRLGTADRLMRYLTVMSIVAWRLFMITLIARTNPYLPCSQFLSEQEWTVLAVKTSRGVHREHLCCGEGGRD